MSTRSIKSSKIRIGDLSISYLERPASNSTTLKSENKTPKNIIFLHGFPFNKHMWKEQLLDLPAEFRGIAMDIRGHGQSTKGHGYFSIDVFAKDLKVFIEKLELEQVILCGISMGGYIALRAYEIFPSLIHGLILCDTHSFADSNAGKQKRFDAIQAILKFGRRPFSIGFVDTIFSKKTLLEKPELVEFIKKTIQKTSIPSICATQLALASRTDTTASLAQIKVPTLVIKGKEDPLVTEEQVQTLLTQIPTVSYAEFEHSAHLPNLEERDKFNETLNKFIQSLF